MHPDILAARNRVAQARKEFDDARQSGKRSEYDAKFAAVLSALNHFNTLRAQHMAALGLEIL